MKDILSQTLNSIEASFQPCELSYLALTSKIELSVRDKWAYLLHRQLDPSFVVSREWGIKGNKSRVDLAILKGFIPNSLIELKAMYSFDALNQKENERFASRIRNDFIKAKRIANQNTGVYALLLATHPKSVIPDSFGNKIVKYRPSINRVINKYGEDVVAQKTKAAVAEAYAEWDCVTHGTIKGGATFGISVDVMYWLFTEKYSHNSPAVPTFQPPLN
jgi:hypothetical protein